MKILQLDARVWLGEASRRERRPVTLGGVSSLALETILESGFEGIWLRGLWELDVAAREALRRQASALEAMHQALPDLELADIDGDPFGPGRHDVRAELGGEDGLELWREDLARRGLRLILDVVLDWLPAPVDGRSARLEEVAALADGLCLVRATGSRSSLDVAGWRAALERVRSIHPHFLVLAEGAARGLGEDASLDDSLYQALVARDAALARQCLAASMASPQLPVRYLENYGGRRAREMFPGPELLAASLLAYLPTGIRIFCDGWREGRRYPFDPRLCRRREEAPDEEVMAFNDTLLELLASGATLEGSSVPPVRPAWEDNATHQQFVVILQGRGDVRRLVAVNLGALPAQCYVDLTSLLPAGRQWLFQDLLSLAVYERDGNDLAARGLYLDLAPWDYNVFEVRAGRELEQI